nr:uncharacterized protein LOC109157470 [Ipomoea trifida]GMD95431.1 Octicosapeptide/Phox/Bem1p family protein isoform 1 [Ipomoea batatas]GMD98838.1 Octicosapeptide/Phox/Bem1p family protein isoform 1 [Ipomoea batatas]
MVGPSPTNIKFLCSCGGKILPRHPDGMLRYYGGETRVLSVERSISFAELLAKLGKMFGAGVSLRCQLPTEDLDALVSITCDEDLVNLIEEYDRLESPPCSFKIRAFLSPPKSNKRASPSPKFGSLSTTNDALSLKSYPASRYFGSSSTKRCACQMSNPPMVFPPCHEKGAAKLPQYAYHHGPGNTGHIYLIHHGNHWQ